MGTCRPPRVYSSCIPLKQHRLTGSSCPRRLGVQATPQRSMIGVLEVPELLSRASVEMRHRLRRNKRLWKLRSQNASAGCRSSNQADSEDNLSARHRLADFADI